MSDESIIPKEAVATPEQIARLLDITADRREEVRKEQERLARLYRSRARLSPEKRRIARGMQLERHYRKTNNFDGLAEALAMQGRYKAAAEVASSEELKRRFAEKAEAVEREDANCRCDDFRETPRGFIPNQYVESYGYSQKHGREMPFIRCTACGELNARPLPDHLAHQQRARRASEKGIETRAEDFFKK